MKKFYLLLLVAFTLSVHSQTVSTFLNSPDANVDDALVFDSKGNLYGSNFYGGVVYKITPDGTATPFITGLIFANGLAVDSDDNLFVAAYAESSINKYDSDGNLLQTFPLGGAYPSGLIRKHRSNNMIFTDVGDSSIKELSTVDGSIKVLYQGAPLNIPVGLAYDRRGDLYIGNYVGREIYRLTARRNKLKYVATVPSSDNDFPNLAFIAFAQGTLYGTVYGEHKVYRINHRKIDDVEIFAGSTYGNMDGNVSEATFAYPSGIVSNRSGNTLYISQFDGLGHIRKILKRNGHLDSPAMLSIKVYPNPASDFINITSNSDEIESNDFNIRLYSFHRNQLVLNKKNVTLDDEYKVSLLGVKTGFYRLIISNKETSISKFIIINRR